MWFGAGPGRLPEEPARRDRAPSTVELVLCRARHPSFSPDLAEGLVDGLTRHQLRRLWTATGAELDRPLPDTVRLHVVVLRGAILERLECDPAPGLCREPRRLTRRRGAARS